MPQNPNVFAPLHGSARGSTHVGVADIETWGLDATPDAFALGVVRLEGESMGESSIRRFTSVSDMREYLTSPSHGGWTFYAHNGSRYDYLSVFGNYWRYFGADSVSMHGSKLFEAKWHTYEGVTRFRDSLNLIPAPLSAIGAKLGYPKGVTPQKFIDGDRSQGITEYDWCYCEQDTEILLRALLALRDQFGELRPTLPSTAMAVFRRRYLPEPVWVRRDLDRAFRESYAGGRVECYRLGPLPSPNYYYDYNSLFPAAMVSTHFPNPAKLVEIEPRSLKEFHDILDSMEGYANVEVVHPRTRLGYLPFHRADGRLLFPIGRFRGSYTFPELRYALSRGVELTDVHRVVASEPLDSPFVAYVRDYYRMKFEAEGFEREIAKLMLNGLYGKFGEFHENREIYADHLDVDMLEALRAAEGEAEWHPIAAHRADGYYVIKNDRDSVAGHSIFSWATYITSVARVMNASMQDEFERLGYETFYTDTDSFTVARGFDANGPSFVVGRDGEESPPVPDSDELGRLKLVYCHDPDGKATHPTQLKWVSGNKFYDTCCERKLKGVRKDSEVLSVDSNGRPKVFRYRAVRGLRDSIRRGDIPGTPYMIAKEISTAYDKRQLLPDGRTIPIEVTH